MTVCLMRREHAGREEKASKDEYTKGGWDREKLTVRMTPTPSVSEGPAYLISKNMWEWELLVRSRSENGLSYFSSFFPAPS